MNDPSEGFNIPSIVASHKYNLVRPVRRLNAGEKERDRSRLVKEPLLSDQCNVLSSSRVPVDPATTGEADT